MEHIIITKTKEYLILKIPTKSLRQTPKTPTSIEERVIQEGLKALEKGEVTKSFKEAKEAISFLRSL
ncbi:MAG: hypothetical protein Q7K16_00805 [Candidatus Azambacteria bacterium]|nr:hypothetical protein [Candidatus Azambacteria bacterium]